jgi:hypothetical protein
LVAYLDSTRAAYSVVKMAGSRDAHSVEY